jgi:hypothetical protein
VKITKIVGRLLLGVLVLTMGCNANKWTSDEFEGIWRPETGNGVQPQTPASITLQHDGRFIASSLPSGFLRLEDVKPGQVLSGDGTWSLTRNDGGREERVRLTFTSVEGSTGRNLPYGAELFIQGSSKEPRLFYFKGDPDEAQRVVFRRQQSSSPAS